MKDTSSRQKAIQAIIDSEKEFLVPADVAPILGVDPHYIRIAARQRPEFLKFEFFVSGNRTKIPRIPFLRYLGIDVESNAHSETLREKRTPLEYSGMTIEELMLAITNELRSFKEEINKRLDDIEGQSKDINNILQSARSFISALSGITNKS